LQVCVRVLTPLHVWSGQVLDGRNELVRVPGAYGLVDGRKLRVLLGRDLPEDRPLWMLVREASADPRAALKYLLADRTKGSSPPAEVRPVVKDAFHRPYLPGSTLRGLLRTAAILQALADDASLRAKAERVALDEPDRFTDWLLDMTKHVARTRVSDSTAFSLGPALYFAGVYRLGQGRPSPMFAGTQQAGRVVEAVPPGARARLVLDGKEPDRALRLLSLLGEWQAGVLEKCGLEAPRVGPPGRWGLVAAVAAGDEDTAGGALSLVVAGDGGPGGGAPTVNLATRWLCFCLPTSPSAASLPSTYILARQA